MIYLTPQTYNIKHYPPYWGQILTPSTYANKPTPGRFWVGDNEAFTKKFEWGKFREWLIKFVPYQEKCLFITVPDVVCDPLVTRQQFDYYAPIIRNLGYRVAFVAQDGQELLDWPEFDALFIGGSTEWKLSEAADDCIRYAQKIGKWVHVGRVNSRRRIRHFQLAEVDSVDGTSLCFAPDRVFRVLNSQLLQKSLFGLLVRQPNKGIKPTGYQSDFLGNLAGENDL